MWEIYVNMSIPASKGTTFAVYPSSLFWPFQESNFRQICISKFLCCYIAPIDILLNHLFQKNHKKRCPRNSVIYRLCQKHIPKNCCKDIKKSYAELYSWGECHIGNKNSSPDMKILYVQYNKSPYSFRQEPLVITFSSSESSSVWPWREEINQLTQGVFNLFLGQETQGGD